jgi:tRNA1Val (adenine37-N6)-methyltransferase
MEISQTYRLFPNRITEVYGREGKSVERILVDFTRSALEPVKSELYIHRDSEDFTDEYKVLTKDFYLKF